MVRMPINSLRFWDEGEGSGKDDERRPNICPTALSMLRRSEPTSASWELRIGDLRVYYDVTEDPQTVAVVAVGIKRRNRVFIGGLERQL